MLASDALVAAATWRPQEFGAKRAADVPDPLVEPLWTGLRVLAFVNRGEARLTDVFGDDVPGHDDILDQLRSATSGSTALLEGVLTPEPLQTPSDVASHDTVQMPNPGKALGTLVVGDRGNRKDRLAEQADDAQRRIQNPLVPAAFVAVDLLWLDDESVCDVPLLERRRILESVLTESDLVRVGIFVKPPIDTWLTAWRSFGFTRIAFKGANSRYVPGEKNREWATAQIPRR